MRLATKSFGNIVDLPGDRCWTSAELAGEVSRRARVLAATGARRDTRVVIAHGGSAEFFADLFAVWMCGAAAVCLDPGLTAAEQSTVIAFTRPVVVLSTPKADMQQSMPVLDLSSETASGGSPAADGALDDPALLLFTSGTTGAPKGVVLTFRAILARIALNHAVIGAARWRGAW